MSRERSIHLHIAYWSSLMSSLLALVLGGFYGLLLMSEGGPSFGKELLGAMMPFWFVGITFYYFGTLSREYWRPSEQHSLFQLVLMSIAGAVTLAIIGIGVFTTHNEPPIIFLGPLVSGLFSFGVVCEIILREIGLFWSNNAETTR
jgi:hypothetical protein